LDDVSMESKTRNTIYLMFGTVIYVIAILVILMIFNRIAGTNFGSILNIFIITLLPLLGIFVMVWGYGLRLRLPGIDIEYYPVEKIMKPATIIDETATIKEAEQKMEDTQTDFLNILDKNGILQGILTRADAHKARLKGLEEKNVKNIMVGSAQVIRAFEKEGIKTVLEKIGQTKHTRFPVVDTNNRLTGIVDAVDLYDFISKFVR
jgi:CBS domain-containing protein